MIYRGDCLEIMPEKMHKYGTYQDSPIKVVTGIFYLVTEVDVVMEKWQIKYDILINNYEQKWGLSMRLEEQVAALKVGRLSDMDFL